MKLGNRQKKEFKRMDSKKRAIKVNKKLNKKKKHSDPRIFREVCLTNTQRTFAQKPQHATTSTQ